MKDTYMDNRLDMQERLKLIENLLVSIVENQHELKKEIRMIFSDITYFESLVLKVMDKESRKLLVSKEKFHH